MTFDNQKGSALVEMALILPLLLLIVVGIFEFGRAMLITNTLTNAAREGARQAAVSSTTPINIDAFVTDAIPFDKTGLAITTNPTTPAHGTPVKVTVTLPFVALTKLIPMPAILRGEATMRYEGP